MFRITLNNGVVSDGQYIVSGASNQVGGFGSAYNSLFSALNVNTTRFDIYTYSYTGGGNIRAMVVA